MPKTSRTRKISVHVSVACRSRLASTETSLQYACMKTSKTSSGLTVDRPRFPFAEFAPGSDGIVYDEETTPADAAIYATDGFKSALKFVDVPVAEFPWRIPDAMAVAAGLWRKAMSLFS